MLGRCRPSGALGAALPRRSVAPLALSPLWSGAPLGPGPYGPTVASRELISVE